MIAPLRATHRRLMRVLVVALPVAAYAAYSARPEPVIQPREVTDAVMSSGASVARSPGPYRGELNNGVGLEVSLEADGRQLVVRPDAEPALPALLAYWVDELVDPDGLPATARLLGPLGSAFSRLDLPTDATLPGTLLAYSLGHQELVGSVQLPVQTLEEDR